MDFQKHPKRSQKLIMDQVDPLSDIDFKNVPTNVLELVVETTSPVSRLTVVNVPVNLLVLDFGRNLSSSLSQPFYLPITLVTYRGPILFGMKLPDRLKKLTHIETTKSVQTSDVEFPIGLTSLVVQDPFKFSKLDAIKFPNSLETFQIVGKYNCSLEKIVFPPSLVTFDVGKSIQPVDLLVTRAKIMSGVDNEVGEDVEEEMNQVLKNIPLILDGESKAKILKAIRHKRPKIDQLVVNLDTELSSLGDVWTEVLLEGRVQVRQLSLRNKNNNNMCLRDCAQVLQRSSMLGRKLCRKLIIESEKFSTVNSLHLAKSLKHVGGISVEVLFHQKISDCLLPRLANLLQLRSSGSKYVSDSFGAMATSLEISQQNKLVFEVGDAPVRYESPRVLPPLTVPLALGSFEKVREKSSIDKPSKTIFLHTWKQCIYCKKQDEAILEYKKISLEHETKFNDKVDVHVLENPDDVKDKRVDSFPTWVKDDVLIPGVQNVQNITALLE